HIEKVALQLRPNPVFPPWSKAKDRILGEYRVASGRARVPKTEHGDIVGAVKSIWEKQDARRAGQEGSWELRRSARHRWLSELPQYLRSERMDHLRSARVAWQKRLAPEQISHLTDNEVLDLAPRCLHAAKRRAQHPGGGCVDLLDVRCQECLPGGCGRYWPVRSGRAF